MSARGFEKLLQVVGYHVVYGLEQGSAEMILRASGGKVLTGWNWQTTPPFARKVVSFFFSKARFFFFKERTYIVNQKWQLTKWMIFSPKKRMFFFFLEGSTILFSSSVSMEIFVGGWYMGKKWLQFPWPFQISRSEFPGKSGGWSMIPNIYQMDTWRIIPVRKWLVTPIHTPFSRFGKGNNPS